MIHTRIYISLVYPIPIPAPRSSQSSSPAYTSTINRPYLPNSPTVLIVAPATQQSAQGGRVVFASSRNLTSPSQYDLIPAGAPSLGSDPHNPDIWYYNGTPAACTFVALDYVLPQHYPSWNGNPDLFVAGPNYGVNLGPFVYSLSGTLGATYSAVARSVPGIAVSASNDAVPYFNVSQDRNDPATKAAAVAFEVVNEFVHQTAEGQRVLPLGYGINVNIPELDANSSSAMPRIVKSRLTGDADVDVAVYDEETGTFDWANLEPKAAGVNRCFHGDCGLPGETWVVGMGMVSVSAFTVDYDAPAIEETEMVFEKLGRLFGREGQGDGASSRKRRGLRVGRDLRD